LRGATPFKRRSLLELVPTIDLKAAPALFITSASKPPVLLGVSREKRKVDLNTSGTAYC